MHKRSALTAICLLAIATTACGNVKNGQGSLDPLRCLIAMTTGAKLAKADGDVSENRRYALRASWFANKVRSLPASEKSDDRVNEATKAFIAPGVDMVGITASCLKEVDDDPAFKSWAVLKLK